MKNIKKKYSDLLDQIIERLSPYQKSMKYQLKTCFSILTLFIPNLIFSHSETGDFYSNIGKMYAVVGVVVVVFIGIILFMFYLDRKLRHLENQISDEEKTK